MARWLIHSLQRDISYEDGMLQMREAVERLRSNTKGPSELFFFEHRDVITYTRKNGLRHLLVNPQSLIQQGIALCETDRGGDITFHGTGQLVGYPITRLRRLPSGDEDIVGYVRDLEKKLLRACENLGLSEAFALEGKTGVWLNTHHGKRKLISIGVGCGGGITKHGFALNISADIPKFTRYIVPCGLSGMGLTNLYEELALRNTPLPTWQAICATIIKQFKNSHPW